MQVSWIIADSFNDPTVDPETLKNIGSIWGSWRTWRAWKTDNILCTDTKKARDLVTRAFQAVCNLYIQEKDYTMLGSPKGVKLFNGEFPAEFDRTEEIIAMHLLAEQNDLVLLLGYNLDIPDTSDKLLIHQSKNYRAAFNAAVKMYPDTQWVLLDYKLPDDYEKLNNLTCDTFENVLQLLG